MGCSYLEYIHSPLPFINTAESTCDEEQLHPKTESHVLGNLVHEGNGHRSRQPLAPPPIPSKLFAEFPLVESLQETQRAIRRKMNDMRDPFISRLPSELASHIFTYFLPAEVDNTYSISYPSRPSLILTTPLQLGTVCQAWRQIAWATPALWTSISVDIYAANWNTATLVQDWLARSGQLPLYIRLYGGIEQSTWEFCPIPSACDVSIQKIFEAVNGYSDRWTYLDLELPECFMGQVGSSSIGDTQSSILKTLKLNVLTSEVAESSPTWTNKFHLNGISSPTNVHINALRLAQVDIGWNCLTHLEAFDFSLSECFDLLQSAPLLVHLGITRLAVETNAPGFKKDYYHQELRSLSLRGIHRQSMVNFNTLFERTTFPALTDLTFDQVYTFIDAEVSIDSMLAHFTRSATRLLILEMKISTLPINYSKVSALLHALPTLESITFECGRYETTPCLDPILVDLASDNGSDGKVILPRLTSLIINKTRFSWTHLFQILSHVPAVTSCCLKNNLLKEQQRRLSFIRIVLPRSEKTRLLDPDVTRKIRSFRKQGLQLEVSDTQGRHIIPDTSDINSSS